MVESLFHRLLLLQGVMPINTNGKS